MNLVRTLSVVRCGSLIIRDRVQSRYMYVYDPRQKLCACHGAESLAGWGCCFDGLFVDSGEQMNPISEHSVMDTHNVCGSGGNDRRFKMCYKMFS